jgi:hypothetical protein
MNGWGAGQRGVVRRVGKGLANDEFMYLGLAAAAAAAE